MFRTMLSPADRLVNTKEYLEQRALLKSRFRAERLEKQDATAAYKKREAPLLEPTNRTTELIAKLTQEAQKQTAALENLPGDLAAVLPLDQPPEYHSQLGTTPQVFGEDARQAIADDAIGFAHAGPPRTGGRWCWATQAMTHQRRGVFGPSGFIARWPVISKPGARGSTPF